MSQAYDAKRSDAFYRAVGTIMTELRDAWEDGKVGHESIQVTSEWWGQLSRDAEWSEHHYRRVCSGRYTGSIMAMIDALYMYLVQAEKPAPHQLVEQMDRFAAAHSELWSSALSKDLTPEALRMWNTFARLGITEGSKIPIVAILQENGFPKDGQASLRRELERQGIITKIGKSFLLRREYVGPD